jgi:uncharacterized membrane protein
MKWLFRSKVLTIAIAGGIWLVATVLMLEIFGVHAP